jgi:hypothetical protein
MFLPSPLIACCFGANPPLLPLLLHVSAMDVFPSRQTWTGCSRARRPQISPVWFYAEVLHGGSLLDAIRLITLRFLPVRSSLLAPNCFGALSCTAQLSFYHFAWIVVPMLDFLWHIGYMWPSSPLGVPFCDQHDKILDHLLLGCIFARSVFRIFELLGRERIEFSR